MAPFRSLREFIDALEKAGELVKVSEPLSPHLEIAALLDREMKKPGGGKALLFTNVTGSKMPVLGNAYGSRKRLLMALGKSPEEIGAEITDLIKTAPPGSLSDFLSLLPKLKKVGAAIPAKKKGSTPPCQEVVLTGSAVDLSLLPVLTTWPDDGGPFVTFPAVFTRDPETGRQNVGMYRLQIFGRDITGMHWHIHKDGASAHHAHLKKAKRMEVAVAIGTDPVVTYSATAPLPHGIDELMLAGFIRGAKVELAKCKTVDLWVPATAEIVLEGYLEPGEERIEGPFGDHTGYYSPADPYPVFHVTAITHRKNPVYFTTVVGIPPMEDEWLGYATERIFLPLLKTQWPEVCEMSLPPEGVFHNLCLATIEKRFPRQAQRLISGFGGAGQMSFTKIVAVLDANVDPADRMEAAEAILDNLLIPQGVIVSEGVLDALDHASPTALWGGKLGLDCTRPLPGEPGFGVAAENLPAPSPVEVYSTLKERFPYLVDCLLPVPHARLKLILLVIEKSAPGQGMKVAEAALSLAGVTIAVAVEGKKGEPLSRLAWRALSSFDPLRDLKLSGAKAALDCTAKTRDEGHPREWPKEVAHTPELLEKIEKIAVRAGL